MLTEVKVWFQNRRIKWRKQSLEQQQQEEGARLEGRGTNQEDDSGPGITTLVRALGHPSNDASQDPPL
uniref:Notochord homeobox n=1 Tax=Callorhinchus milii TaxID=7868 RepID=A0A4W3IVS8_CALMI